MGLDETASYPASHQGGLTVVQNQIVSPAIHRFVRPVRWFLILIAVVAGMNSAAFGQLLSAPTLFSPANGATGVSTTPTFSWSSVPGANRYWLMVATSSSSLPTNPAATSCPGCVITGSTDVTSHTLPDPFLFGTSGTLSPNTTYFWQVQAWNANGTDGNDSQVFSFTTAGTPPTLASASFKSSTYDGSRLR